MAQTQKTKYQESFRLKKGDTVVVLAGKDKGSTGKISRVDFKKNGVFVEGINLYKKHKKATSAESEYGILDIQKPLHISNVALVDPKSDKPSRVGYRFDGEVKQRLAKKSQSVLDS